VHGFGRHVRILVQHRLALIRRDQPPAGTNPAPGPPRALRSSTIALIEVISGRSRKGILRTQVLPVYLRIGQRPGSGKLPRIIPTSRPLTVTGAPASSTSPQTCSSVVSGSAPGKNDTDLQ